MEAGATCFQLETDSCEDMIRFCHKKKNVTCAPGGTKLGVGFVSLASESKFANDACRLDLASL